METIPHFINGNRVSDAERFGPVFNPATGEPSAPTSSTGSGKS
jgi:hypothetical protein